MNREASVPDIARFFEIRLESIGGLGAHAAGQIVATAAVLRMGMNGSHFSSYGSEKKGSVVRSFVRLAAAAKAIRTSAPIETPDVVVVFHSGLLAHPATLAGIRADGLLIYSGTRGEVPDGLSLLPATTTSGVSIGALVRMAFAAAASRTKERTTEPFFSEP